MGLAGCALSAPGRVMAPEANGLFCPTETTCVDDLSRLDEAVTLTTDALRFVETRLGPIDSPPRVLFCSSTECFARFGNPQVAALYYRGLDTMVINETGWEPYILRHELIHHWQQQTFGTIQVGFWLPEWYLEGMAYTLSEDPRRPIPHPPAEALRVAFEAWVAEGNDWHSPPG